MPNRFQADDLTMSLVQQALSRPEDQRESYLRDACGSNTKRFEEALDYIVWEKRMQGFLLDPLQASRKDVCPFEPGATADQSFPSRPRNCPRRYGHRLRSDR